MERTVLFREFEERDIDSIYQWKNDAKLNEMTVGQYHPFSYEDAVKWVHGCMGEHETFKFWAVCTNDNESRIVGWASLAKIDQDSKSAFFYSLVIGEPKYKKGLAWIEIQQYVMEYTFNVLKLNRLEYSCLSEHPSSMAIGPVMFFKQEGLFRQAVYKNNRYYDVAYFGLLKDEYQKHYENGDYDFMSVLERYANYNKRV